MKIKFRISAILILVICCQFSSAQNSEKIKNDALTSIDSLIQRKMKEAGVVGLGAALIIDKKLVWTNGYGYADREDKTPFTPSTVMNIASISKTFTGVCIMKAVEEGILSLDEDINNYLPFKIVNPHYPDEKVTLRHLATHTSGLIDRYPFHRDSTYFYGGTKPEPLGEFLKNYFVPGGKYYSKDHFLNSKPGTYRQYSNVGAGLAGYIVELKTGKKLSKYAKKHIFKPLKMVNTGWALDDIDLKNHTEQYAKQEGNIRPTQLYELTTYPDGGVRTSVIELSRFFISLLNDGKYENVRILKKETAQEMLRFNYTESNKPENIKLNEVNSGIFWATKMNTSWIGHNGSDYGVKTFMLSDLNKEVGVILFSNTSFSDIKDELKLWDILEELFEYGSELKKDL